MASQGNLAAVKPNTLGRGPRRREWLTPNVVVGAVRIADCLWVALTGYLSYLTRFGQVDTPPAVLSMILLTVVMAAHVFHVTGFYLPTRLGDFYRQLGRVPFGWLILMTVVVALAFLTKTGDNISRVWIGLWFAYGVSGTLAVRLFASFQLKRWQRSGILTQNVVVVGAGEHGKRFVEHLKRNKNVVRLIGLFDDRAARVPDYIGDYPVLGSIDDLLQFARHNRIDQIIVALPWTAEHRVMACMKKLKTLPIDVRLCPDLIGFHLPHRGVTHIAGVPLINVFEKPLSGWDFIVKSIEDRLLAAIILLFIAPLMASIALAIKLTSNGPVIFKQQRFGFNNEMIEVFKFRSMYVDRGQEGGGTVDQARRSDPRVTPLGRILRMTSLDELPQFINVLRGDMSIVGPRPHAVSHNEQYARLIDEYLARHRVRPGITGWAQVNGFRGQTDTISKMEKRVQHDLFYIENWSLRFDMKIIVMTLFVGFSGPNAY